MRYRQLGNTGLWLPVLGLGAMRLPTCTAGGGEVIDAPRAVAVIDRALEQGISCIDTAWSYHDGRNEAFLGQALAGRRDQVILSTKSPWWKIKTTADFRSNLEGQLRALATDHVDLYLFHGLKADCYDKTVLPLDLIGEMRKARSAGLIRAIGFSVHDQPEFIRRVIDDGWAEVLLCQYNLLDRSNESVMAYAKAKGLGVLVMGPVGGGRLGLESPALRASAPHLGATPELALRFVLANPDITTALSGMSTPAMVDANAGLADRDDLLSPAELAAMRAASDDLRRLADLYCTGCNYCLPCPAKVRIPQVFQIMNLARVYGLEEYARTQFRAMSIRERGGACTRCGLCETRCPQRIAIRDQLQQVAEALG